jgi:hypothetical protein
VEAGTSSEQTGAAGIGHRPIRRAQNDRSGSVCLLRPTDRDGTLRAEIGIIGTPIEGACGAARMVAPTAAEGTRRRGGLSRAQCETALKAPTQGVAR